jgi:hypothetical protein
MFDLYLLVYLCGYMVTAVTVTVCGLRPYRWKHEGLQGEKIWYAGGKPKVNRDRSAFLLSIAYTQTIVLLYANGYSPVPHFKRKN